MRSPRNTSRQLFRLTLTLVGLMSWNILPLHLSGRVVEAATHPSLTTESLQSASTAIANGRIAFVSRDVGAHTNADIYTINADGSDRRRLTFDPTQDADPAWSPDGTKIAFVRFVTSGGTVSAKIYVMNADGSDERRLTEPGANNFHSHPTWSPDGTKIAFAKFASNSSVIVIMNADGSDQRTIFGDGFNNPAWSPDGLKLVGQSGYDGLVLINIDGSNLTHITQPPQPFDPATYFADWGPAWSPGGSKIVFTRFVDCDINDCYTARLYVVNSDGSNPTDLTHQDNLGNSPAWSPDGTKIVFGGSDLYVMNPDGSGLTNLTYTNDKSEYSPSWQPLSLPPVGHPIDDPAFFVRQHYLDFLNREPDSSGLDFWTHQIADCGGDQQCVEIKRVNVSAAFFLSIEFQETGYLAYRAHKAAYGDLPGKPVPVRREDFLPDAQRIGQGVVVGVGDWRTHLENNKRDYFDQFAATERFLSLYPQSLMPEQFIDALNQNAGGALSQAERDALVAELKANAKTRAQVLRAVAEDETLRQAEFNKAFVLMQYFGYLRRDPDSGQDADFSGYNFWLQKLNDNQGDFHRAEMVRAFIESIEYRKRFGQ